jgi:acyl-CoA thioesterase-1
MARLSEPLRSVGYGLSVRGLKALAVVLALAAPVAAEPVTVAALGDSLTHGYGLPPEQGFVPQLQEWLRARGHDATVINAGVSGDTTAGGLSRVGWTLTPEVDAMIVALGGNDVLRGIDPAAARANLRGILQAGQAQGVALLLVGIAAPGNYGPDYKQDFEAIYPELAAEFGALLVPDFLAPLTAGADPAALGQWFQPDRLHPNAEGVARIVEGIGPAVEELVARAAD